jgi:hypothetical protein
MRIYETEKIKQIPEASFLKVSLRLRGELAPTQRWRPAQLAPTRELAPTEVLKNCPLVRSLHRATCKRLFF